MAPFPLSCRSTFAEYGPVKDLRMYEACRAAAVSFRSTAAAYKVGWLLAWGYESNGIVLLGMACRAAAVSFRSTAAYKVGWIRQQVLHRLAPLGLLSPCIVSMRSPALNVCRPSPPHTQAFVLLPQKMLQNLVLSVSSTHNPLLCAGLCAAAPEDAAAQPAGGQHAQKVAQGAGWVCLLVVLAHRSMACRQWLAAMAHVNAKASGPSWMSALGVLLGSVRMSLKGWMM